MDVSVNFANLNFASGASFSLENDSIVVFVGPNSSGKSQSLRDLWRVITNVSHAKGVSITNASVKKNGTAKQYQKFLQQNSIIHENKRIMSGLNISPPEAVDNEWNRDRIVHMGRVFASFIKADDRFSAISKRDRIDRSKDKATYPLQALDFDPGVERQVSRSFHKIFGQQLMLDRGAGAVVNLHVGPRPDPSVFSGEFAPEFSSEVRKRPDMIDEGDGLKAAAGLFLQILAIPKSIYLIDEPDVFLHPPQAYVAAKETIETTTGKQLFLATHNAHFVRGLLDANSERVILVRLDRSGTSQYVNVIEKDVFLKIGADPLTKFSNLLDALFFRTSVICENEADCLFYRNLCRAVDQSGRDENVFWLSAHGKQNIRKFSTVLKKFGLRVVSIPDLDIINNEANLRSLVESHDGNWADFESDFSTVAGFVRSRKPTVAANDVKLKIIQILDKLESNRDDLFPAGTSEQIRAVMSGASPWRELKESGIASLGRGQNRIAAESLITNLRSIGILVPPVGEMESFFPVSGKHGIEWVNDVLSSVDVKCDEKLSEARKFAVNIVDFYTDGSHLSAPLPSKVN